jgi:hypothetical protein
MLKIENQICLIAGGKSIAMESGAVGRGQFGVDLVVLEEYGIVARLHVLVGVVEARAVSSVGIFAISRDEVRRTGPGHDEEVKQVAAAGSTEMRVAEAHDGVVRDVVTGTPVPAVIEGVWAELDCPEGHSRAGEAVTMSTSGNARIDPE